MVSVQPTHVLTVMVTLRGVNGAHEPHCYCGNSASMFNEEFNEKTNKHKAHIRKYHEYACQRFP